MQASTHTAIVLFDGVCNLCDQTVQFIINHDPKGYYKFAPLQTETAKQLLQNYQLEDKYLERVVLIEAGKSYTYSTAALRITRKLSGLWPLLYGLIIVPKFIRDRVYKWVAQHRYQWFGKKDSCAMPTPENRARFLS